MQEKDDKEVRLEAQTHRPEEVRLFQSYIDQGELPDLDIGHANDFADLR